MAAAYPKSPELQAFEDWARDKTWFKKTKGHFGRNCNDTCYTHYTVNDRANAFLAGVKHAHLTQPAQAVDVGDVARASAVHAAVGAIYFNDGSDYLPALWTVVRYLAPELMDELSSKPADVWHRTMAEVDRLTAALPNANGKEG